MQQTGIQLVCQTLHQMYWRIVGNLPPCTRETHFTVLERFHIEPPLIVLHKLANQAHQSLTEALTMVHSHDVIHRINWSTLNATRTLLTSELCKPAAFPESDSEPEEIACIYCAFIAPNLPELQRHHTLGRGNCFTLPLEPVKEKNGNTGTLRSRRYTRSVGAGSKPKRHLRNRLKPKQNQANAEKTASHYLKKKKTETQEPHVENR